MTEEHCALPRHVVRPSSRSRTVRARVMGAAMYPVRCCSRESGLSRSMHDATLSEQKRAVSWDAAGPS